MLKPADIKVANEPRKPSPLDIKDVFGRVVGVWTGPTEPRKPSPPKVTK